ncbi:hypothetical protein Tco_1445314, partial [Tanacetum coccineum]
MFDRCKSLFDIHHVASVFEWVISELLSVVGYDFSKKAKSAYDVIPHKFLDLGETSRFNLAKSIRLLNFDSWHLFDGEFLESTDECFFLFQ